MMALHALGSHHLSIKFGHPTISKYRILTWPSWPPFGMTDPMIHDASWRIEHLIFGFGFYLWGKSVFGWLTSLLIIKFHRLCGWVVEMWSRCAEMLLPGRPWRCWAKWNAPTSLAFWATRPLNNRNAMGKIIPFSGTKTQQISATGAITWKECQTSSCKQAWRFKTYWCHLETKMWPTYQKKWSYVRGWGAWSYLLGSSFRWCISACQLKL
jgi:hypothetical protein